MAFLLKSSFYIMPPFIPLELKKRSINPNWVGLMFATFAGAFIILGPFVPAIINKFGRRKPIIFGLFITGLSFIALGLYSYLGHGTLYLTLIFINMVI